MEFVIYDCHRPQTVAKTDLRPLLGKLSKNIGYNLLIIAFAVGLYAASPSLVKEAIFRFGPKQQEINAKATFGQINREEEITRQKLIAQEAEGYGVTTDFSLVIPKINAKAQIIPNVDPGNKEEYTAALKQGIAHAYGTDFPGGGGNIFLFSHSTNVQSNVATYNAIFYLLKELEAGDKVIVFYAGQKFEYQVSGKETVEADNTGWLTPDVNGEKLILQTCWPPGTSLKRLIVIAKPV
ncbi:hypothetical protein COS55_01200 [Candidatus Shapirobacteria bacterium CG03_land_8_20_14_0_80_40_19]|uniref:Sortase n=4 Tax=Candidatus Shapironibacteriota TaxID=1752721 RepID=A0A2M7BES1_9BACT|nr:MAG: hypothetical protein COV89_00545 [Candidatus Shapirobacteria bacterium CG11_big_fil_rev_8_21_14_0_20_40_12]PIV01625.1 MAG: hypothetical protein COS55_01200 [Candidatus Shapirobacteria bacterium CG03_land_8_20_14_0_80_40_19]PJC29038.1 MAG: hypothetical protein CO053_01405 [Candidatus Shapirobacteria bacterium CG_4_9_14_0_2_um_filter_40_11]PJC76290.1 MAG: hypothetical protein CO010_02985 [Candidatus Shapirobacteria bacterium CG_4_8_14_3_um_filter_39_11]